MDIAQASRLTGTAATLALAALLTACAADPDVPISPDRVRLRVQTDPKSDSFITFTNQDAGGELEAQLPGNGEHALDVPAGTYRFLIDDVPACPMSLDLAAGTTHLITVTPQVNGQCLPTQ